jgi:hypothetical protein
MDRKFVTPKKVDITEENKEEYEKKAGVSLLAGMTIFLDEDNKLHRLDGNAIEPLPIKDKVADMITLVTDKLFKSSQKYGTSSYVLNDMTREIQEEIVDLVGWSLMESVRLMEALKGKIYHADEIYWENFLKRQDTSFLEVLKGRVSNELTVRKFAEFKQETERYVKEFKYLDELRKDPAYHFTIEEEVIKLRKEFDYSVTLTTKILDLYNRSKEGFYVST